YFNTKQQHKNHVLFYQMGDFYEVFWEDAELCSKVLGITLTARGGVPMAGVPLHAKKPYLKRLIQNGYSVAICDQVEDAKQAKGIVKREVTEIITPGVQYDYENLNPDSSNYLLTLVYNKKGYYLSFFENSTLEFKGTFSPSIADIIHEIYRNSPSEILLNPSFLPEKPLIEYLEKNFRVTYRDITAELISYLPKFKETIFEITFYSCFSYLYELKKLDLKNLPKFEYYELNNYMRLSETTISHLEIFLTSFDKSSKGSLFSILNQTLTSMGARKLRNWLSHPLVSKKDIEKRLDSIDFFIKNSSLSANLKENLKRVYDIERLLGRILSKKITPRDFLSLAETLTLSDNIFSLISKNGEYSELLKETLFNYKSLKNLSDTIFKTIEDEPASTPKDGNVIKKGIDKNLDEIIEISKNSKEYLLHLELKERQESKIPTLKIGYNKVFGYFIEISKAQVKNVPEHYEAKQTLTNATRFITPELKELEEKILSADESRVSIEERLYDDLCNLAIDNYMIIKDNSSLIAQIDLLISFSTVAVENRYSRPNFVEESGFLNIEEGRHPVLELNRELESFIPNSLVMNKERRTAIITGPNMAGKSTIMRQSALISIMAQVGSFVPAKSYNGSIFDAVYTRVGASDFLTRGESTFMVEMRETAEILNGATESSLLIIDELGRGTSTFDGVSLAWAIAEYINDYLKAATLFATHYHELAMLKQQKEGVVNFNIEIKEINGKLYYLRKLSEGVANRSYGIHVAELAGINPKIIKRASKILSLLEEKDLNSAFSKKVFSKIKALPFGADFEPNEATSDFNSDIEIQQYPPKTKENTEVSKSQNIEAIKLDIENTEFQKLSKIAQQLKSIDLNQTTPFQALLLLNELKNLL
ncbi:DNA mismatch repair protein MutS, partial [bacterium]|nr:DNA mismatch repair protein MutS [bacterium]